MANLITNDSADEKVNFRLSNGGMSVVVSILSLAGSNLASTNYEIDLVTWIASRDQAILGSGIVGFDLHELPWVKQKDIFIKQKGFLLKVINRVDAKEDLHYLDYEPPFIDKYVEKLNALVNSFDFNHVSNEEPSWWLQADVQERKCTIHGVYLHESGCVVCNDE